MSESILTIEQQRRVELAKAAREILQSTSFVSASGVSPKDVIKLATWLQGGPNWEGWTELGYIEDDGIGEDEQEMTATNRAAFEDELARGGINLPTGECPPGALPEWAADKLLDVVHRAESPQDAHPEADDGNGSVFIAPMPIDSPSCTERWARGPVSIRCDLPAGHPTGPNGEGHFYPELSEFLTPHNVD